MFVNRYKIEYSSGDTIVLIPIGDIHVGCRYVDYELLKKVINDIHKHDDWYWCGVGDYFDAIIHSDNRFDHDVIDPDLNTLDKQLSYVEFLFEDIADKCLFMLNGNHDDKIRKKYAFDLVADLCRRLNIDYAGYDAFVRLTFDRGSHMTSIDIFASHGRGNGRTTGSKINNLEKMEEIADADLYMFAHTHDIGVTKKVRYYLNRHCKLVNREQTFVLTGGFLSGYSDEVSSLYTEKNLYKPSKVGCPIIKINPEDGSINVEI